MGRDSCKSALSHVCPGHADASLSKDATPKSSRVEAEGGGGSLKGRSGSDLSSVPTLVGEGRRKRPRSNTDYASLHTKGITAASVEAAAIEEIMEGSFSYSPCFTVRAYCFSCNMVAPSYSLLCDSTDSATAGMTRKSLQAAHEDATALAVAEAAAKEKEFQENQRLKDKEEKAARQVEKMRKLQTGKAEAQAAAKKWKNTSAVQAFHDILNKRLEAYRASSESAAAKFAKLGCAGGETKAGWIEITKELNDRVPGHGFTAGDCSDKVSSSSKLALTGQYLAVLGSTGRCWPVLASENASRTIPCKTILFVSIITLRSFELYPTRLLQMQWRSLNFLTAIWAASLMWIRRIPSRFQVAHTKRFRRVNR